MAGTLCLMAINEMERVRRQLNAYIDRKGQGAVKEVSEAVKTSRQHLGRYRDGEDISYSLLKRIANYLDRQAQGLPPLEPDPADIPEIIEDLESLIAVVQDPQKSLRSRLWLLEQGVEEIEQRARALRTSLGVSEQQEPASE